MKNFNVISLILMITILSSHVTYTEESDRTEQPDSIASTQTSLNRQVIPCLVGTLCIAVPSLIIGTLCYYLDCNGQVIAEWAGAVALGMTLQNHFWTVYSDNQKQYWAKVGSIGTTGSICATALLYILITEIQKRSFSL